MKDTGQSLMTSRRRLTHLTHTIIPAADSAAELPVGSQNGYPVCQNARECSIQNIPQAL